MGLTRYQPANCGKLTSLVLKLLVLLLVLRMVLDVLFFRRSQMRRDVVALVLLVLAAPSLRRPLLVKHGGLRPQYR